MTHRSSSSQSPCIFEALSAMALTFVGQDELARAEATLDEAITHTTRIGYLPALDEARATLAFVLVELERAREAEALARKAVFPDRVDCAMRLKY